MLVFPGHVVKLSDFGYARPLYEGTQYEADENVTMDSYSLGIIKLLNLAAVIRIL